MENSRAGSRPPARLVVDGLENPVLNQLEDLAAARNQTLAGSAAALDQARALVTEARSEYFRKFRPIRLTSDCAPAETRRSTVSPNAAYHYNLFTAPLNVGWEIDLWGRVRQLTRGARARMEAAGEDLESLKLLLQAELAQDYFTLRAETRR